MANNPRSTRRNPPDDPPAPDDEPAPCQKKSDFKKPIFWVNVITLIVIAVYTCFACNQVQQTQTANSIAKKALTEVNKPYVMFAGLAPSYTTDNSGLHFHVGALLTNYGNTPAQYLRTWYCDPLIRDNIVQPQFNCNVSEAEQPYAVLGPKQSTTVIGPVIKESDIEGTKNDKTAVYVFGYVEYQDSVDTDAVGNPRQRVTRFCQRIIEPQMTMITPNPSAPPTTTVVNPPPGAPITQVLGFGCNGFVCMDETCKPLK